MIITDGVHLVSTESENELHQFAQRIGLKRSWYQNHPRHPHYDIISPRLLQRAYSLGAQKVGGFDILKRAWWAKGEHGTQANQEGQGTPAQPEHAGPHPA